MVPPRSGCDNPASKSPVMRRKVGYTVCIHQSLVPLGLTVYSSNATRGFSRFESDITRKKNKNGLRVSERISASPKALHCIIPSKLLQWGRPATTPPAGQWYCPVAVSSFSGVGKPLNVRKLPAVKWVQLYIRLQSDLHMYFFFYFFLRAYN